jgi:hypothetical protein
MSSFYYLGFLLILHQIFVAKLVAGGGENRARGKNSKKNKHGCRLFKLSHKERARKEESTQKGIDNRVRIN